MKISFIGYGNIARAIAKNWLEHFHCEIRAAAPSLPIGVDADGVFTHHDNALILNDADVIVLAVKPNQVANVLNQVKHALPKDSFILSLAAGISLASLQAHCLEKQSIIRAMPNTPIAVGKGATPLIANAFATEKQKECITRLFQYSGIITWLTHEEEMDALTSLSGSGPAYVFFFLESMIHAAESFGLSHQLAKEFALQTVMGAAALMSETGEDAHVLRRKVTSPGGTTAAAIQVLQEEQFESVITKAMKAAWKRAKQSDATS